MATNHYFVDPDGGSDLGGGTKASPWKTTQHALDTITQASSGEKDQINIRNTAADVLSGTLSLATYGSPQHSRPLILSGYTNDEDDGGQGELDGDGSHTIWSGNFISGKDMKLGNCGSSTVVSVGAALLLRCEIHTTSGNGVAIGGSGQLVTGCNLHNIGGRGVSAGDQSDVYGNYFFSGPTHFFDWGILVGDTDVKLIMNRITLNGQGTGIRFSSQATCMVAHNTILGGGTGGTLIEQAGTSTLSRILNNIVEGASGSGGKGIALDGTSSVHSALIAGNRAFNNVTHFDFPPSHAAFDNSSLEESPIAKEGDNTFANRFAYFAPKDVNGVLAGAYVG